MKTEKIEELLVRFGKDVCTVFETKRAERLQLCADASAELAVLKEENEGLREATIRVIDTLVFCEKTPIWPRDEYRRIQREHHEAVVRLRNALGQKEDKIAHCQKRAIELVYGGKYDAKTGAEIRQILVDEFGKETVAALDLREQKE